MSKSSPSPPKTGLESDSSLSPGLESYNSDSNKENKNNTITSKVSAIIGGVERQSNFPWTVPRGAVDG